MQMQGSLRSISASKVEISPLGNEEMYVVSVLGAGNMDRSVLKED